MPLYEYRCLDCGNHLEVLQKFSDRPLRRCKECSGKLEKLISRTSFQLKGGGWYAHGYGAPAAGKKDAKGKDKGKEKGKETGKKTDADTGKSGGKGDSSSDSSGRPAASA